MRRSKKSTMVLIRAIQVLLLTALIGSAGCSNVTLHPILKQDIVEMKQGEPYTPDRHGYFLSDLYVKEVMQAKVEKVNLK